MIRNNAYLNAVIANWTVRASWRPVELTGDAPLHSNGDSVDLHISIQWSPKVVLSVFFGRRPRDDPGVHEGGQAEVHDDEDGQNPLIQWNHPEWQLSPVPMEARIIVEQGSARQEERPGKGRRDELGRVLALRHDSKVVSRGCQICSILNSTWTFGFLTLASASCQWHSSSTTLMVLRLTMIKLATMIRCCVGR